MKKKTGLLVANVGSPLSPRYGDVRRYLQQFLMDPKILPLPWLLRALLVYGCIVPFRTRGAAKRYKKIWTPEGPPLVVQTQAFVAGLQRELGDAYIVRTGMALGAPSIESAMEALWQECDRILFLPMFPQYANSSNGAVLAQLFRFLSRKKTVYCPQLQTLPAFDSEPFYLDSMVDLLQSEYQPDRDEHLLFSYHGLPQAAVASSLAEEGPCYPTQCRTTTESVALKMGLPPETYSTCFQSRLGRQAWTQPYVEEALLALYTRGIRRVAIVCPGFAADCLETQLELGVELQDWWKKQGGISIHLIPCLNARPFWIHQTAIWISSLR